jgi:hypothetical protein
VFVEEVWDDRLGRRRELVWDDRIGDPLSYGWDKGDPLYCRYHASPMWVKRRQRAKAE